MVRAVFLVRHPFRAALAEYQRAAAELEAHLESVGVKKRGAHADENTHVRRVVDLAADRTHGGWAERSKTLAQRWLLLVGYCRAELFGRGRPFGRHCSSPDKSYAVWLAAGAGRSAMWVRHEDLDPRRGEAAARAELQRVIAFACPHCSRLRSEEGTEVSRSALWALRAPPRGEIAALVENGGAGYRMWDVVRSVAPRLGYDRYNYDAIGLPPSEAAAKEEIARRHSEQAAVNNCPAGWQPGFCEVTTAQETLDASQRWCLPNTTQGGWSGVHTFEQCLSLCATCDACAFVSFSKRERDCGYFSRCPNPRQAFGTDHCTSRRARGAGLTTRAGSRLTAAQMKAKILAGAETRLQDYDAKFASAESRKVQLERFRAMVGALKARKSVSPSAASPLTRARAPAAVRSGSAAAARGRGPEP